MKLKARWLCWLIAAMLAIAALAGWLVWRLWPGVVSQPDPAAQLPVVDNIPAGAQLLLYPIDKGVVTAGYQHPTYLQKNGYAHYGTDYTSHDADYANILASGDGEVLGVEACTNSLGTILVVRYNDVYNPTSGEVLPVIARYYHLLTGTVQAGDTVTAGQVIGTIYGSHASYHHVHIELDRNVEQPFNTPQVAEASSQLLNRYPADGSSLIDPVELMVLGEGQYSYIHPNSDCCAQKDNPRYRVGAPTVR